MKPISFLLFAVCLFPASCAFAQEYRHQLGVRLGSTDQVVSSGFSYRYHIDETQGLEILLNLNTPVSVALLYERFRPLGGEMPLRWYYGGGAFAGFRGRDVLGATGILGLDYQFEGNFPVNLSADWKPELTLVDAVRFRAGTVGLTVRFSFPVKK
ncbi:MAG TPA: hypothetical protein PKE07_05085 [Lacibacter sp.]|nr:hypothetical protein [Lacibacter sp.]HMO90387.1 hypothetical protein [Lacibacter sp.]